jgi:hypothetical protein
MRRSSVVRVEFQGGPVDGMRDDAPDDITTIYLTDVGSTGETPDPFEGKSLGKTTYEMTDQRSEDGAIIFLYIGSIPNTRLDH